jgi:hypothetical protein
MSPNDSTKVIGYFAVDSDDHVLCEGDACVIASDETSMKHYIQAIFKHQGALAIRKTRFIEIAQGLALGASYAFDFQAYQRFAPLASKIGMNPTQPLSLQQSDQPLQFIVIQTQHSA